MTGSASPSQCYITHNVRIEPMRNSGHRIYKGGIVWDGTEPPGWTHHMLTGRAIVADAQASGDTATTLKGHYVWGGAAIRHYGHFLTEYAPRLLYSARHDPASKIVYLLPSDFGPEENPEPWFWRMNEWLGFPASRVTLVRKKPVVLESLAIYPQGEHNAIMVDHRNNRLNGVGPWQPTQEYLEALDQNLISKNLSCPRHEFTYVSKANHWSRLGAERYLEQVLRSAGVNIVHPGEQHLATEIGVFAGSRHLVFAESSAIHTLQLMGHLHNRVSILSRRPGRRVGIQYLVPRGITPRYYDVVSGNVFLWQYPAGERFHPWEAFPLTREDRVLDAFSRIGIDLTPHWDSAAFDYHLDEDLKEWVMRSRIQEEGKANLGNPEALAEGTLWAIGEPQRIKVVREALKADLTQYRRSIDVQAIGQVMADPQEPHSRPFVRRVASLVRRKGAASRD